MIIKTENGFSWVVMSKETYQETIVGYLNNEPVYRISTLFIHTSSISAGVSGFWICSATAFGVAFGSWSKGDSLYRAISACEEHYNRWAFGLGLPQLTGDYQDRLSISPFASQGQMGRGDKNQKKT